MIDGQSGKLRADVMSKTEALLEEGEKASKGVRFEEPKRDGGIRKFLKVLPKGEVEKTNKTTTNATQQSDISATE